MILMGTKVVFDPKVFKEPYGSYYDAYKGHVFEVVGLAQEEPYGDELSHHYRLSCMDDPTIVVWENVHVDELLKVYEC